LVKLLKGRLFINLFVFSMSIILWIVCGAIIGCIASMVAGTNTSFLLNIIVGIIGAFLGGWIMTRLGYGGLSGFNLYSFLVALGGAIVLLLVIKLIRG